MTLSAEIRGKAVLFWHFQRVKRLVRERAQLGPHVRITVSEIPCDDPACPGPATQITILGLDLMRRVLVVHRPAAEVTAADLAVVVN